MNLFESRFDPNIPMLAPKDFLDFCLRHWFQRIAFWFSMNNSEGLSSSWNFSYQLALEVMAFSLRRVTTRAFTCQFCSGSWIPFMAVEPLLEFLKAFMFPPFLSPTFIYYWLFLFSFFLQQVSYYRHFKSIIFILPFRPERCPFIKTSFEYLASALQVPSAYI